MKKTQEQLLKEELGRFMSINKYIGGISEQEDVPAEEAPVADEVPAEEPAMEPEMGEEPAMEPEIEGGEASEEPTTGGLDDLASAAPDMSEEPAMEPEMGEDTEEVDVTDLVDGQKELEEKFKDTEEKISQSMEKVDGVFSKLDDLESKMDELDKLYSAIDQLGQKIDQAKPKTPEEKLELRSLDSYPFNQKLTDFFDDKETEMEITGKNEYVLTSDDVKDMSDNEVRDSFKPVDKE
jgi:hypothetical protein